MKECSIEGCTDRVSGHGFCGKHYARWKRHGDPSVVLRVTQKAPGPFCTLSDCGRQHFARGLCNMHWQRWRKTGDPLCIRAPKANSGSFKKGQAAHNKGIPATAAFRARVSQSCKARFQRGRKLAGTFSPGHEPWNTGKMMPDETRLKIKQARAKQVITAEHRAAIAAGNRGKRKSPEHVAKTAGPNHYRWKGGTTRNLSRREWRELRAIVIERDQNRCRWCCRDGITLIAHHVIAFDEDGPDSLENLIAVCRSCHTRYHCTKPRSPA